MKKLFILFCSVLMIFSFAAAEEYEEGWILCRTDSCVNVRELPKKRSHAFGEVYCGDKVYTDGKVVNGYLHCVNMATETGDGWIAKVYVVDNEPWVPIFKDRDIITTTRVAARKTIDGQIRKWLYSEDEVIVYAISDEWCVTNYGFVKTEFIDVGSFVKEKLGDTSPEMTWDEDD